jgi:hypothetical protein
MTKKLCHHTRARHAIAQVLVIAAALLPLAQPAMAASWKGLEPFVSKRADVERVLGKPDRVSNSDTLHFNIKDEAVTVYFVTPKFIAAKKLSPALEGTVLQIVLQHERATDTPESLRIVTNSDFKRESKENVDVFMNVKEGISYMFINNRLRTTRFSYSEEKLARETKS